MKALLFILLLLALGGVVTYVYFQMGANAYREDFQNIVEDSGISLQNIVCKQGGQIRKAVCYFTSNRSDILKLNEYLMMQDFHDKTGQIGRSIFMYLHSDPCDYDARITRGDKWLRVSWNPSRAGAQYTTYSGAAIIYDAAVHDACMILDIAYG